MPVDTSVYQNQPNPLGQLTNVFGILTAQQQLQNLQQQNQLLQTANKQNQFNLNKSQTDAIIGTLGPLAARGDVNKATALTTTSNIIRSLGIPPQVAGPLLDPLMNAPDDPKVIQPILGNMFSILSGAGAAAPVSGAIQPGTLAPTTVPLGARVTQGTLPVAPGPQATAAASAYGGQAGGALAGAAANETDFKRQVTPLEQAIPALERLGTTGTGPGKAEVNQLKSVAVAFGFAPQKWTGTVKDFDEANKYLTDWVRQNGDTSTNDKLAAAFSSSATTHISNAAAVDVAKTALAIRRMKYMQLQEFYKSGLPPEQFPQFASKWNAQHDPRAFGFDHLTVPQRKAVLQSLPPGKRAMFMFDVRNADDAGVLTNQPTAQ